MTDPFNADDDLTQPRGHRLDASPSDQIEPPRVDPMSIGELTDPDDDVSAYGGSAAAIRAMSVAAQHPVQFASNLYGAAAAGVQKFVGNTARHIVAGAGEALLGGGDDSNDPDEGGSSEGDGEGGESGGGDSGGGESGGGSGGGEASSGEAGNLGGWTPGGHLGSRQPHELSADLELADVADEGNILIPDDATGHID